jgi:hypothetical protein
MKFEKQDAKYKAERAAFSANLGNKELWSAIDHWPLYCGVGNLARFLAISDIFRSTLHVPGHVAEFGSWRGANLMFLAKMLRIYDPNGSKEVFCFDTFEGLTNFAPEDSSAKEHKNFYAGNYEELCAIIKLYEMENEIRINRGLIEDTLPKLLEQNQALSFSFAYIDTDLYLSTQTILKELHPRLGVGGVFVLDEWNHDLYPGEGQAANEFLREYGDHYRAEQVVGARQPTLVLRKTKY